MFNAVYAGTKSHNVYSLSRLINYIASWLNLGFKLTLLFFMLSYCY